MLICNLQHTFTVQHLVLVFVIRSCVVHFARAHSFTHMRQTSTHSFDDSLIWFFSFDVCVCVLECAHFCIIEGFEWRTSFFSPSCLQTLAKIHFLSLLFSSFSFLSIHFFIGFSRTSPHCNESAMHFVCLMFCKSQNHQPF